MIVLIFAPSSDQPTIHSSVEGRKKLLEIVIASQQPVTQFYPHKHNNSNDW